MLGGEADLVLAGSPVAHARHLHRNRPDPGQHLALGQGSMSHQPGSAVSEFFRRKCRQERRQLRLDRLFDELARASSDHLGQRIGSETRWIGKSSDGIVMHVAYPFLG